MERNCDRDDPVLGCISRSADGVMWFRISLLFFFNINDESDRSEVFVGAVGGFTHFRDEHSLAAIHNNNNTGLKENFKNLAEPVKRFHLDPFI